MRAWHLLRLCVRVIGDAYDHFNAADGWAIASHIALSILLAMFPFLILVTSLAAALFGSADLANEVARLLLDTWPEEVAAPIAQEIRVVLTSTRGDLLTISVALAIFFASGGIESLRIGLNRAYGEVEQRYWFVLRLESIGYVIVGAIALLAMAFLIVLGPLLFATASRFAPGLDQLEADITITALRGGERELDRGTDRRPQVAAGRPADIG